MDKESTRYIWLKRLDDMHLYQSSHDSAAQLFITCGSVIIGIWLPLQSNSSPASIAAACFVHSLGLSVNALTSFKRKKYFIGRLLAIIFGGASGTALYMSVAQIIEKDTVSLESINILFYVILGLLIIQGIDFLIHGLVNPPESLTQAVPIAMDADEEKAAAEFLRNSKNGNMGNVGGKK